MLVAISAICACSFSALRLNASTSRSNGGRGLRNQRLVDGGLVWIAPQRKQHVRLVPAFVCVPSVFAPPCESNESVAACAEM